jgi:hypothetical protein
MRASTVRTPPQFVDETLAGIRSAPRPLPPWQRWLPAVAVVILAVGVVAGGLALSDGVVGHRLFRPGPTANLKTLDTGEYAFDYPATWLAYDASVSFSGGSATAVLGTLPVERHCGDVRHVDINCVSQQRLEAGHVRLYVGTGTYRGGTIQDRPGIEDGTMSRVEVGGMPAIFAESDGSPDSYYREDKSLHWEIARPGTDGTSVVELEARLTEPGLAEGLAQLEALVASFRFTSGPDPSPMESPIPTPTEASPRLADLRVMTVEDLIAAAMSPTAEEVVVHGWLTQTNVVRSCPLVLDPHPLVPYCEQLGLTLTDEHVPTDRGYVTCPPNARCAWTPPAPSIPVVVPRLGVDAHADVSTFPGSSIEVQAIGHLADHRWTTCPEERQAECKARFVIDRLVPADQPLTDDIPEPWASPSDHSVDGIADALDVVSSVVGGVSVLSIGVADMEPLRAIEPRVDDINNGEGAWVIRALVGGDPLPIPRTFLVGHIGWWTLFEVTESGLIDRTRPVDGAPTAVQSDDPDRTFPPTGAIVVFLAKDGGFELPKVRVAVVDLSGRVAGVRAPRPNEPRPIDLAADGPVVFLPDPEIDGRFHLYWTGGVCDDEMVVTIDASMSRVTVDAGHSPPCDAMGVERRLVLDVDGPVDPAAVEVRYAEASAGAS